MARQFSRPSDRVKDGVLLSIISALLLMSLAGLLVFCVYNVPSGCTDVEKKQCLVSTGDNDCKKKYHQSVCVCSKEYKADDGPVATCVGADECLYTRKRVCRTHEDESNICVATGVDRTNHTCMCNNTHYVRGIGWKSCESEGIRVYEFFESRTPWHNASQQCTEMGFDGLVVFHSENIFRLAAQKLPFSQSDYTTIKVHIGLYGQLNEADEQVWTWVDGKILNESEYVKWGPHQPQPKGVHHLGLSCIQLWYKNGTDPFRNGVWVDEDCGKKEEGSFMCEKFVLLRRSINEM